MAKPKIELFFDLSSPWTYLGFVAILKLREAFPVDIVWRPILVGGVLNKVNPSVYTRREETKSNPLIANYLLKDIQDWANFYAITIKQTPPAFHPVNSTKIMRGCFVAEEAGLLVPYALKMFHAYWAEHRDTYDDVTIGEIVTQVGMDRSAFFAKISSQPYKDKLRANTDELIERGGYGSPTFFINSNDMYFGQDRMPLITAKIARLSNTDAAND